MVEDPLLHKKRVSPSQEIELGSSAGRLEERFEIVEGNLSDLGTAKVEHLTNMEELEGQWQ